MELPDWLASNLPTLRPAEYITYRNGQFVFRDIPFNSAEPAYDFARTQDANFDFDDVAKAAAGWGDDVFFYTAGNRLLPVITDQEHLGIIENDFSTSQELIAQWRDNKDDFESAYHMLDFHPAFWTRCKAEPTWTWVNSGIVSEHFWFSVSNRGMMMECGGHIDPDYTDTYHDLRLDTYGKSFEDCIIQTAALVDKFFHDDGTPREGVEYEKSELELTLESRMAEWKAQNE